MEQAGPMSSRERIEEVLDSIRPAIRADGGDVELLGFDESSGIVEVRLVGACETCPISMATLKDGIEKRLRSFVPGVVEVTAV
jgi:Fe-S cluster biogenesis protein NfuA